MILTDAQATAIVHATRPLQATERAAFLAALEVIFAGRSDVGDGELGRALRDLQRKFSTAWLRPRHDAVGRRPMDLMDL
jgi:hypothetical protein